MWLFGGSVSLGMGFEVLKEPLPSLESLSLSRPTDHNVALSY